VAQHLCASEGWGPPVSNADAMHVLARQGVVTAELAEVLAQLDRVDRLEGFVAAVARWITG